MNLQMKIFLYNFLSKENEAHPIYTKLKFAARPPRIHTRQQGCCYKSSPHNYSKQVFTKHALIYPDTFCIQKHFYFGKIIQLHS